MLNYKIVEVYPDLYMVAGCKYMRSKLRSVAQLRLF